MKYICFDQNKFNTYEIFRSISPIADGFKEISLIQLNKIRCFRQNSIMGVKNC